MSGYKRIAFLLTLSLIVLLVSPFLGGTIIKVKDIIAADGLDNGIFWRMRVPRVLLSFVAGASLSVCGVCFQALFRNSLATPYTLGVSSGAALGVTIAVWLGASFSFAGQSAIAVAAFLGALLSAVIVFLISRWRGRSSTEVMLLSGVAVNFFFSSLIMFIQYLGNEANLFKVTRWMMGRLSVTGYQELAYMTPVAVVMMAVILVYSPELDLLSIGEEFAASRGVDIAKCKIIFFLVVSLLCGTVVSFCGPIGFVGMVCPHICRLIFGSSHKVLTLASMLFGGVFLTLCDVLARSLVAPSEMPVGIITSLLGCPFFLWLLSRRR